MRVERVDDPARIGERVGEVEAGGEAFFAESADHVRILAQDVEEGATFLPGPHGVVLDGAVRVVALHARLHQRKQHGLAEHEPIRRVEVLPHPRFVHHHAFGHRTERPQHVVRELQRVGKDDPFDGAVRDITLVPQRDVLEPGDEIRPQHARQAAQLLRFHRVPLVGHRARALL